MMDEDFRSCDMWLYLVKNEGNIDRISFAWSRNLLRSEQRNSNYTHNQNIKYETQSSIGVLKGNAKNEILIICIFV